MNMNKLDQNEWVKEHAGRVLQPGWHVARIATVERDAFLVRDGGREILAELAGRFRFDVESSQDLPCVGDWVCVEYASEELAIIHAVLPRKTCLRRKSPGKTVDFQMIAANIDVAFIVQSCHYDFNVRRLNRYLVACSDGGIEPIIILSKIDLLPPEEVDGLVLDVRGSGIGAQILPLSNMTGDGLERFHALLEPGRTYCFVGSSGVGKSTLINRLLGHDELDTKSVSASGEGTHTTSRRQLLVLDNGTVLIDTPGMRELGLLGTSNGLDESFSDIRDLSLDCRFANCTHTQEPGCAVLEAVENDEISAERYQAYLKLKKETEFHNMSYVEKRKKDKDFGRFVKSVMKHKKR
jgi:ribosome biogenesis GTPase